MKLLNRSLLGLLIFAVAVLLIVTPVLYVVINSMIIGNVDRTLQVHKREIQSRLEQLPSETAVQQWEDLDGEVFVEPLDGPLFEDSVYTIDGGDERERQVGDPKQRGDSPGRHAPGESKVESYRVLTSSVIIKGKPYRLQARVSLVESEDLIRTLGITQLVVLIVLLAGMLIINWWNSRTLWNPFYKTLDTLRSFQIEKSNPIELGASAIVEFNDLNAAIEGLTRRDHQAFASQREFTENAAHEMQTPLAIFQSKVELLLQTKPTEQQAVLIEALLDATSRLNRLNKTLLLLAKIDNGQFPETATIDLLKATESILRHYEVEATSKGSIIYIERKQDIQVAFNGSLLEVLLSNLIANAIRHGDTGSPIQIVIDGDLWEIRNQGSPIPIPVEGIFQRFRKGTSHESSLGLGLALVKKICDANDVGLSYSYQFQHHVFSLKFLKSKISPKSPA